MSDQVIVAGAALIAFGSFFVGYGLGWGQCNGWRDHLDLEIEETERRTALLCAISGRAPARERRA